MERLILARHAESTANAQGIVNGDPAAGVCLTPLGEEQARALGSALAGEPLDLCIVTAFPRTRATAGLALAGRDVPVDELPGLGDPGAGAFEGRGLDEYRAWAWANGSETPAPGGGESRRAIVDRYAASWRAILARPERTILAVAHALPVAYLLAAREGLPPAARMDRRVEHAKPHRFAAAELAAALAVVDRWREEPTW